MTILSEDGDHFESIYRISQTVVEEFFSFHTMSHKIKPSHHTTPTVSF